MSDAKLSDTPMAITTKLNIDKGGAGVDEKSLLYLTASRPNIMFNVSMST